MDQSSGAYAEEELNLAEQRGGHGTLLLTPALKVLFIDERARMLCEQIQHATGQTWSSVLPISLIKICAEITDILQLRNHPKDWERFAVKRVIGVAQRWIFLCGVGLPGLIREGPAILLTLDYIASRASLELETAMTRFSLTRREVMVVQNLRKGWTNKEIANELHITEQTAKEHLKHIMEKTQSHTRTGILCKLSRRS